MSAAIHIRPEGHDRGGSDAAAIRAIHRAAFERDGEAGLVDALRRDGALVLSLVAESRDTARPDPVGHVAFSRLSLPGSPVRACALAPLAVAARRRREGIGAALVREGLRRLADAGEDLVLVVGDPAYYGRFGFTPEAASPLRTPYGGPYLQALAFTAAGRGAGGAVAYAAAFDGLG